MSKRRKKKKNIVIIPILIVLVICVLGTIYLLSNKKKLEVTTNDIKEVSLNEEIYNLDFIKDIENGEILTKKEKIDTSTIGTKKIKIIIKDNNKKEKTYEFELKVIDIEKPVITYKKELSTTQGTKIDLLKDVKVKDDSNEKIEVKVEGTYDFNKVGTYNLEYVAKDSSGNEAREKFTLKVNEKPKQNNTNTNTVTKTKCEDKNFVTENGYKGVTKNCVTYIDGYLIANKTYSLPSSYGSGLTSEFMNAFNKMRSDYKKAGIKDYPDLKIVSGFRSYSTQKSVYNRWVSKDGKAKADTYSARPGYSEHQSGLAADLNHVGSNFDNTESAKWLEQNCWKYGFILRYPKGKDKETGYIYESWHFRYVGVDLAKKLYNNGNWITMEAYFGITSQYK